MSFFLHYEDETMECMAGVLVLLKREEGWLAGGAFFRRMRRQWKICRCGVKILSLLE